MDVGIRPYHYIHAGFQQFVLEAGCHAARDAENLCNEVLDAVSLSSSCAFCPGFETASGDSKSSAVNEESYVLLLILHARELSRCS